MADMKPPELDDSVSTALASTDYSSQDGAEVVNAEHAESVPRPQYNK